MTKQLIRAAATTVLGLSLTAGFASADISNTGQSSHNSERSKVSNTQIVRSSNKLSATNNNPQKVSTGSVGVYGNTTAGNASSGGASASSSTSVSASSTNSGSGSWGMAPASAPADLGNISQTGQDSSNTISSTVNNKSVVVTTNSLSFTNNNAQTVSSGSVKAAGNTTVGSVTSGNASANSSTSISASN